MQRRVSVYQDNGQVVVQWVGKSGVRSSSLRLNEALDNIKPLIRRHIQEHPDINRSNSAEMRNTTSELPRHFIVVPVNVDE